MTGDDIYPKFELDFGSGFQFVDPPQNWFDIKLEALFTSDHPSASLQSINFAWMGTTATLISNYWAIGKILQGIACRISVSGYNLPICVLDAPNEATEVSCDIIKTPIKRIQSIDWFLDQAASFNFAFLAASKASGGAGIITPAMYKKTPYVKTDVVDVAHLLMMIAEEITMALNLYKELQTFVKTLEDLPEAIAGCYTAGFAGIAGLLELIFEIITEIAYIVFLAKTMIDLFLQIREQIYQDKKYKYCMRVEDCIRAGLTYIDPSLKFSSTIFTQGTTYADTTIMPRKIQIPASIQTAYPNKNKLQKVANKIKLQFDKGVDDSKNALAYGHPDNASFKDFLADIKTVFNASDKIFQGKYEFEEKHHWLLQNLGFVLPNEGEQGYTFQYPKPFGFNVHELAMTNVLQYQLDEGDLNTIKRYQGTTCCINIVNTIPSDPLLMLNPGLSNVILPFSLASRKVYLSVVEQAVNILFTAIDGAFTEMNKSAQAIIGALNSITGFLNKVFHIKIQPIQGAINAPFNLIKNDRIGWLEISSDTFSIPKIFIGEDIGGDWHIKNVAVAVVDNLGNPYGSGIAPAISATGLMMSFHAKNLMTRKNQWLLYKNKKIKMCLNDFKQFIGSNVFTTADKKIGKFEQVTWNLKENQAENINYRIQHDYIKFISETIIIDGN